MGRPAKQIDPTQVARFAEMGYNNLEIAARLDCSHDTLERRFACDLAKGHQIRNSKLRAKQIEVALNGNVPMLIWLGKQYLGQKDKQEVNQTGDTLGQLLAEFQKCSDALAAEE